MAGRVGDEGPSSSCAASLNQRTHDASKRFQYYLDKLIPYSIYRWIVTLFIVSIYALRIYNVQGFYVITYGLGIYILGQLIGFLSPLTDPGKEGPILPTKGSDEFKPFIRRLPESKFWYATTRAICIAFVMTFFPIFDVPVFWPILLFYWFILFVATMKNQIAHMMKYKYLPFNVGKRKYKGKKHAESSSSPSDSENRGMEEEA